MKESKIVDKYLNTLVIFDDKVYLLKNIHEDDEKSLVLEDNEGTELLVEFSLLNYVYPLKGNLKKKVYKNLWEEWANRETIEDFLKEKLYITREDLEHLKEAYVSCRLLDEVIFDIKSKTVSISKDKFIDIMFSFAEDPERNIYYLPESSIDKKESWL